MLAKLRFYSAPILLFILIFVVGPAVVNTLSHAFTYSYEAGPGAWVLSTIWQIGMIGVLVWYSQRYLGVRQLKWTFNLLHFIWTMGLIVVAIILQRLLMQWFDVSFTAEVYGTFYNPSPLALFLQTVQFVILAPVLEEWLFRVVVMNTYFKNSRYYLDVLSSGVLFMLVHIIGNWQAIWIYLVPSFVLALTYRLTQHWQYSALQHMILNLLAILPSLITVIGWYR